MASEKESKATIELSPVSKKKPKTPLDREISSTITTTPTPAPSASPHVTPEQSRPASMQLITADADAESSQHGKKDKKEKKEKKEKKHKDMDKKRSHDHDSGTCCHC